MRILFFILSFLAIGVSGSVDAGQKGNIKIDLPAPFNLQAQKTLVESDNCISIVLKNNAKKGIKFIKLMIFLPCDQSLKGLPIFIDFGDGNDFGIKTNKQDNFFPIIESGKSSSIKIEKICTKPRDRKIKIYVCFVEYEDGEILINKNDKVVPGTIAEIKRIY